MGLFDFLKRDKKEELEEISRPEIKDEVTSYLTDEGRRVYELCETNPEIGQGYDSTRLIVDKNPKFIDGQILYDCMVSWYGENDAILFGKDGSYQGRQFEYEHVIAGINPGLMETDPEYLNYTIKELFKQERVKKYLKWAMMTETEIDEERNIGDKKACPCGRYIGEVQRREDGRLGRMFNMSIGKIMHGTAEMQSKRRAEKQAKEARRQEMLATKRAEIARLQAELEAEER